jgi:hypothetical protein
MAAAQEAFEELPEAGAAVFGLRQYVSLRRIQP